MLALKRTSKNTGKDLTSTRKSNLIDNATHTTSYVRDPDGLFIRCAGDKYTMGCVNCIIPGSKEISILCEH